MRNETSVCWNKTMKKPCFFPRELRNMGNGSQPLVLRNMNNEKHNINIANIWVHIVDWNCMQMNASFISQWMAWHKKHIQINSSAVDESCECSNLEEFQKKLRQEHYLKSPIKCYAKQCIDTILFCCSSLLFSRFVRGQI